MLVPAVERVKRNVKDLELRKTRGSVGGSGALYSVSLRLSFNRKQSAPGCRARFYEDRGEDPEETKKNPSRNIMKIRMQP